MKIRVEREMDGQWIFYDVVDTGELYYIAVLESAPHGERFTISKQQAIIVQPEDIPEWEDISDKVDIQSGSDGVMSLVEQSKDAVPIKFALMLNPDKYQIMKKAFSSAHSGMVIIGFCIMKRKFPVEKCDDTTKI